MGPSASGYIAAWRIVLSTPARCSSLGRDLSGLDRCSTFRIISARGDEPDPQLVGIGRHTAVTDTDAVSVYLRAEAAIGQTVASILGARCTKVFGFLVSPQRAATYGLSPFRHLGSGIAYHGTLEHTPYTP